MPNALTRPQNGFTRVEIMIGVVIIGLLAAMAIPAFQKVRTNSQDKAVLDNARQLSAGADQWHLENGLSTVALTQLIGPTSSVKALNSVARETHPTGFTRCITARSRAGPPCARSPTRRGRRGGEPGPRPDRRRPRPPAQK